MRPDIQAGAKVLIADADPNARLALSRLLSAHGCLVRSTGPADTLLKWLADPEVALIILDASRAEAAALQAVRRLRASRPDVPVILTGDGALTTAVRAVEAGAFEHLAKPYRLEDLLEVATRALAAPQAHELARAQARAARDDQQPMIGRSPRMQDLYRTMARLLASDLPVLVVGESGTGKALIARALHDMGPRAARAFVPVSAAIIDPDRIASELFGEGASAGRLVEADGGTLFLDAIGDLPPGAQARLLRLLDGVDPTINPDTGRPVDVRIVAAASQDLNELVRQGRFRQDLFYRINVAPLRVPPLRERPEDIPDLARTFLLRAHRQGQPACRLDAWAEQRLQAYDWPGNVRELENLLRRICAIYPDEVITAPIVARELVDSGFASPTALSGEDALGKAVAQALGAYFGEAGAARPTALYEHIIRAVERPLLEAALEATQGNKFRAAELLGINRNTLKKKMIEYGLALPPLRTAAEIEADRRRIAA